MPKYIYDHASNSMVEVTEAPRPKSRFPMIQRDLPAYMSPLSGREVDGRTARREEMKVYNVREKDPSERIGAKPVEPGYVKEWRANRGIVRSDPNE